MIKETISLLSRLVEDPTLLASLPEADRVALMQAAGKLSRPTKLEARARNKNHLKHKHSLKKEIEKKARAQTGIREARTSQVFSAPLMLSNHEIELKKSQRPKLISPRKCYVCDAEYTELHHFYDQLCAPCGDLNYMKRFQNTDLTGRVALITGSRLKIGYQATLKLLRSGATVVATTRFPVDSALRFAREADFESWKDRLHVQGLDLRHTPSVELFTQYFKSHFSRLDFIINNAAQTVRRPPAFFKHLIPTEQAPRTNLPSNARHLLRFHDEAVAQIGSNLKNSTELALVPYSFDKDLKLSAELFPEGKLDCDLQQVDLRSTNSWRLTIEQVDTTELLEVQLINAIAPFVINSRLIPLMQQNPTGDRHIVNVTAMEGKFYRFKKNPRHPHTNMAKAALNMMTHTAATGLIDHGIYMNAVDTGWVTDEDPAQMVSHKKSTEDFQPPLDIVDGAARICDPFIDGILTGRHWNGKFLKDYTPTDW